MMALELGIYCGVGWETFKTNCKHYNYHGKRRRRRRGWPRRRRVTKCEWKQGCDVYVKGYVMLTIVVLRIKLEFKYWMKNKAFRISVVIMYWVWKWNEAFNHVIYRHQFHW